MLCSNRQSVSRLLSLLILSLVLAANAALADNHFKVSFADGARKVGLASSAAELRLIEDRLDANFIPFRTDQSDMQESLGFIVVTDPFSSGHTFLLEFTG